MLWLACLLACCLRVDLALHSCRQCTQFSDDSKFLALHLRAVLFLIPKSGIYGGFVLELLVSAQDVNERKNLSPLCTCLLHFHGKLLFFRSLLNVKLRLLEKKRIICCSRIWQIYGENILGIFFAIKKGWSNDHPCIMAHSYPRSTLKCFGLPFCYGDVCSSENLSRQKLFSAFRRQFTWVGCIRWCGKGTAEEVRHDVISLSSACTHARSSVDFFNTQKRKLHCVRNIDACIFFEENTFMNPFVRNITLCFHSLCPYQIALRLTRITFPPTILLPGHDNTLLFQLSPFPGPSGFAYLRIFIIMIRLLLRDGIA